MGSFTHCVTGPGPIKSFKKRKKRNKPRKQLEKNAQFRTKNVYLRFC